MMCSGHAMVIVLMNKLPLWWLTKVLHNIKQSHHRMAWKKLLLEEKFTDDSC